MPVKATDTMLRADLRRLRIQPLVHLIMHAVAKHIGEEGRRRNAMRAIYEEVFDLLHKEGVEILTDHMRAEMGLPPRGPDGWTIEEIVALERLRLELLTRPLPPVIIPLATRGGDTSAGAAPPPA
jgi:hypothetical protein